MSFKEFVVWCNYRACDGKWGLTESITCIHIMSEINSRSKSLFKFITNRKCEDIWHNEYEEQVMKSIVNPINKMIRNQERTYNN